MSRHNRRRSRGGRKHASANRAGMISPDNISLADDNSIVRGASDYSCDYSFSPSPDFVDRIPMMPAQIPMPRSTSPVARVWHNRYIAWQARLQREHQETVAIKEAERRRIFGNNTAYNTYVPTDGLEDGYTDLSSDDEAEELDEKMMNYFQGLEWLD